MKQHTNQEIMEYFDIKPGDRFEYEGEVYTAEEVINFSFYLNCQNGKNLAFTTCEEVQEKIKALPRMHKIGDNICSSTSCHGCPLSKIACGTKTTTAQNTISEIYHAWVEETGYHVPELEEKLNEEVLEK